MVAIMIADITNPFYHPLVRALQDAADPRHYDVMIANSDHFREGRKALRAVGDPPPGRCGSRRRHTTSLTKTSTDFIDRTGAAVAAVGQHIDHPQVDVAFSNDEQATSDAIVWLGETKGHRQIGFIGVASHNPIEVRRRSGYERAMRRADLETPPGYWQFRRLVGRKRI